MRRCRSGIYARCFFAVGHEWPTYIGFSFSLSWIGESNAGRAYARHHENSFSVIYGCFAIAIAPIVGINAVFYMAMKGGIGPIAYTVYMAVFDRIEMDVIEMGGEIRLITNGVLPKTASPNRREVRALVARPAFNLVPAHGIVRIVVR